MTVEEEQDIYMAYNEFKAKCTSTDNLNNLRLLAYRKIVEFLFQE